ncbi:uncharacterized protein LOC122684102 [Cervus elaphus]|uniref:uncharacterized protein LOC122684102 n=1 Tax=Cervus elaphus TaxID=9860 RepID=UPI001CC2C254|nr:uncharacterized protein LOC122684102 [Cervus elaphus]
MGLSPRKSERERGVHASGCHRGHQGAAVGGTAAAGGGGRVAGVCSWRRRAACRGRFGPKRQARGSTGSARARASVRGASWVCALGACRRQEPPADLPPYLPADSPVGCGFLRAQRSWEDVPGSLGALGPLSAAPGSGKGLRPRCSPAVVLPGRIRALPTPTVTPALEACTPKGARNKACECDPGPQSPSATTTMEGKGAKGMLGYCLKKQ